MKNKRILGCLLLLLTAMIWGAAFAFQRTGMETIGPFTFTASRMALSAAAVGAFTLVRSRRERRGEPEERRTRRREELLGGICCGGFLAAATLFQQAGIVTTTAGKAGFITAMYMLLVPVLGFLLFGRKNGLLVWLAVALGVAGLYLLTLTERLTLTRGDALCLVCALLFSGHILCCDHFARRGDPVRISAVQFVTATLVAAAAAFAAEQPSRAGIAAAAIPILYCGVLSGGVGYTLQMTAQRFTDPTVASLLMCLESVFAVLAGALLLGERMSPREAAGCAVLFAAILLVQLPQRKKEQSE